MKLALRTLLSAGFLAGLLATVAPRPEPLSATWRVLDAHGA